MTVTVTFERGPRRGVWGARFRRVGSGVTHLARRLTTPHKLAVSNLARMPLFLGGAGCVDFAAFHVNHGVGWLVTGLSLILIEHMAADE